MGSVSYYLFPASQVRRPAYTDHLFNSVLNIAQKTLTSIYTTSVLFFGSSIP